MVGPERARRMFKLSLDAMSFLAQLIAEEGIACDLVRCGSVMLAAKPRHLPALEQSSRFLREELGYETEILGGKEMARVIGSTRYHGALLDPTAYSLQPAKYVTGLVVAAERVQTDRGRLRAREVLAATNGYTPSALPKLRRRVVPIGSYIIATQPLEPRVAQRLIPGCRVLSDTKNLLYYFRLSPDGRMVFGGRASFTPASPRHSAAILKKGMQEVFPELADASVEYAWSGKVGYPIDHLPHAGRLDGVHYAMGYCGHGVALATYLGNRMGQVLAGVGEIPDLGGMRFKAIPLFEGFAWFLPIVGGYYRARDWLS
jgi:glycine/D-amino acid oxidase-like deaminating enzyme